jgi:pyrophosphatase PpaX
MAISTPNNQSENNKSQVRAIDTVLFDFDGTVMDTTDVIIGSWQHTFMTFEGKERPVEEIIKTFGEILSHTMKNVLPHVDTEEAIDTYRSYHRDNFGDRISVFEGMTELLAELKRRNYKTGLVTSRLSGTTWEGLHKYDLADYFDVVVSCDDTDKHKPDPTPVNIALERLGSKPENAIMLGDTKFDILCARNAGVISVLVGWHVAMSEEDISGAHGPDYMIDKAEDLLSIIEAIDPK